MPWAQPYYQIYYVYLVEEAGCDVSGVADCFCLGLCRIINRRKLCVENSISVAYANMPYCIAKYCHISYESNQDKLQITVQ